MTRRFVLRRVVDVTGVSGTGAVADGVLWPDGTASVRWRGEHPSVVFWPGGMADVQAVHGHDGGTEVVWLDDIGAELSGVALGLPAPRAPRQHGPQGWS